MGWSILADAVLVLHGAFIAWATLGALAVWRWPVLVWAHLPALAWGVWIEASAGICPLTPLENALRHGDRTAPVEITLTEAGVLTVANEGPVVPSDTLSRLTRRFERVRFDRDGSGLGLAIVSAIAERIGGRLELKSPRPGRDSGFEARMVLGGNSSMRAS